MSYKRRDNFRTYLSAYHNEVTGSRLLLVIHYPSGVEKRVMIDCGYFQEIDYRYLNYIDDLDPDNIDAILITHNHIDHTGLLPKMIRLGYRGKIFMTSITEELLRGFLVDICDLQEENCKYLKNKYPEYAHLFNPLFDRNDVEETMRLCVGKDYRRRFELFDGDERASVTFFENGHLLGASMILVECKYEGRKAINYFFTGDYRLKNVFFDVPQLPKRVRNMEIIMVHEATYGTTSDQDIKKCFDYNLQEAFKKKQSILIGAFAQGRMQEILYRLKMMQDAGKIPGEYEIIIDGSLGIETTEKYQKILEWYNPEKADFLPEVTKIAPAAREHVLTLGHPVIVITTSGMLSNGPARIYVPIFVVNPNAMIHLAGYAAEETLARHLLETKRDDKITIGGTPLEKKAVIKTTREMTSHSTIDDMIEFISQFKNIRFLAINHGEQKVKDSFIDYIADSCDNVEMTDVLDRKTAYCIYQFGKSGERFSNMTIKKLNVNLDRFEDIAKKNGSKAKNGGKKKKTKKQSKQNKQARYGTFGSHKKKKFCK